MTERKEEIEIDRMLAEAKTADEIFNIIKENYEDDEECNITYSEISHIQLQNTMSKFITTDKFIPISNFPYILFILLRRHLGEKWNCDKCKLIPVKYREDWDTFVRQYSYLFDRWLRFFQSIPDFLREKEGIQVPIKTKRFLKLEDISPNLKQLLSIKSEIEHFCTAPLDISYCYDLSEFDIAWDLENLTQLRENI